MQKKTLGISLSLVIAISIAILVAFQTQGVGATPLSQADIEAKAIAHAQNNGLQGAPSSKLSKQITMAEFNARLDPFSRDTSGADTTVWLVILKGNVSIKTAPDQKGNATYKQFDNMWVLLSTRGEVIGWGSQTPGHELDLNTPAKPLKAWPTATNPKK